MFDKKNGLGVKKKSNMKPGEYKRGDMKPIKITIVKNDGKFTPSPLQVDFVGNQIPDYSQDFEDFSAL
jgi:hypothetical protein